MWSQEDITENDRILSTVEYKGTPVVSDIAIVAVSPTASVLLSAITEKIKPQGNIVVSEYTLNNPLDYAMEKSAPETTFLRNSRFPVTKIGDYTLVNISENPLPQKKVAEKIVAITQAKEIIVLRSVHRSFFVSKEAKVNDVFTLSTIQEISNFPAPNTITGVAANLIILSQLNNITCSVHTVIEEDCGTSVESLEKLNEKISILLRCDSEIATRAFDIFQLRNNDMGMIYS